MARSTVSASMTSATASTSSCANAASRRVVSGSDVIGLPPITSNARTLPCSISSASAAHGRSPKRDGRSGRLGGPGSGRAVEGRVLEPVAARERAGVEPRAAGLLERAGDDLHRPRQPLGDVGLGGHRAAGAGDDRDGARGADGVDERGELVRRRGRCVHVARSRVHGATAARSSSTPAACTREVLVVRAVVEQ